MPQDRAQQHVSLPVAAALACHQLAPVSPRFYDAEHLSETLCLVAHGLTKVAPVFVADADGKTRPLTDVEVAGVKVSRGATRLELGDGRVFDAAFVRRRDLHDAISILKATGHELLRRAAPPSAVKP